MRSLLLYLLLLPLGSFSQCLVGSIGVSGPGCGCLSGCDLTPWGGPNCSPAVSGNCNAGYQYMSVIIPLEADCEVRVEARMGNRPGCTASGADGNSPTNGDRLRVREVGGTIPPWQFGPSNSTLVNVLVQQGGEVLVEGFANRADEIITYEVFFESGTCPFCILLPIELVEFNAVAEGAKLHLNWATASESNNSGFYMEASRDMDRYERVGFVQGAGNSSVYRYYNTSVELPAAGLWYVRLAQQDYNGALSYSPVVAVEVSPKHLIDLQTDAFGAQLINRTSENVSGTLSVYRPDGRVWLTEPIRLSSSDVHRFALPGGFSIIVFEPDYGEPHVFKVVWGN